MRNKAFRQGHEIEHFAIQYHPQLEISNILNEKESINNIFLLLFLKYINPHLTYLFIYFTSISTK